MHPCFRLAKRRVPRKTAATSSLGEKEHDLVSSYLNKKSYLDDTRYDRDGAFPYSCYLYSTCDQVN